MNYTEHLQQAVNEEITAASYRDAGNVEMFNSHMDNAITNYEAAAKQITVANVTWALATEKLLSARMLKERYSPRPR